MTYPHAFDQKPKMSSVVRRITSPLSADFTIFTSMRVDPILESCHDNKEYTHDRRGILYMPELHRQRLWKAAAKFWPEKRFAALETTNSFEAAVNAALEERERTEGTFFCPMKAKFSFTYEGRTTIELNPVPALPLEALFPSTLRLPSEKTSAAKTSRFGNHVPSILSRCSPSRSTPHSRRDSSPSSKSHSSASSVDSGSSTSSPSRMRSELPCTYEIWVDNQPTPQDDHTSYKTSHRPSYTAARMRALPDLADMAQEVLLWNEHGFMTEGSVLTPYFYRGGKWVTPAVEKSSVGGQRGTSRRWALQRKLAVEGVVEMGSIRVGERVWLSNGVRGFGWGRVQATRREETESAHSEW